MISFDKVDLKKLGDQADFEKKLDLQRRQAMGLLRMDDIQRMQKEMGIGDDELPDESFDIKREQENEWDAGTDDVYKPESPLAARIKKKLADNYNDPLNWEYFPTTDERGIRKWERRTKQITREPQSTDTALSQQIKGKLRAEAIRKHGADTARALGVTDRPPISPDVMDSVHSTLEDPRIDWETIQKYATDPKVDPQLSLFNNPWTPEQVKQRATQKLVTPTYESYRHGKSGFVNPAPFKNMHIVR